MVPEQFVFLLRFSIYFCISVLSFLCWIPQIVTLSTHNGYCLLYSTRANYGCESVCGFCITITIIVGTFYATYMFISNLAKLIFFNRMGYMEEAFAGFVLTVVADFLAMVLFLVSSCMISHGFNILCWALFETLDACSRGHLYQPVFSYDFKFHSNLKMAEIMTWVIWLLWVIQLLAGLWVLRRSGFFPTLQALNGACCNNLPCVPRCICNCRLQFERGKRSTPRQQALAAARWAKREPSRMSTQSRPYPTYSPSYGPPGYTSPSVMPRTTSFA